jgi:uncharacterized protein (DUF2141 family)
VPRRFHQDLLVKAIRCVVLLFVCAIACAAGRQPEDSTGGETLTVLIRGIGSDDGRVGVALFNSPIGFPFETNRAVRTAFGEIHSRRSLVTFTDLKPGTYAVAVFHDENGNGKLDRDWLGFPVEPSAVSNNPKRHIHRPTFEEARFSLQDSFCVEIRFQ